MLSIDREIRSEKRRHEEAKTESVLAILKET
jgi:hypothetical protein